MAALMPEEADLEARHLGPGLGAGSCMRQVAVRWAGNPDAEDLNVSRPVFSSDFDSGWL